MKRLIITIIIGGIGSVLSPLYSSTTISRTAKQDCSEINLNDMITSSTPISVYLNDKNESGTWNLEILDKWYTYQTIECLEEFPGYCVITPDITHDAYRWSNALREYNEVSHRDCFIFRLSFTDTNDNIDEVYIKWGLLPSRPLLSEVEYTYQYDWDYDMIYPNGFFSFKVDSRDAEYYWLYWTDSFLYEPPYFFSACCKFDAQDNDRIGYDADWGEFVIVSAQNKFGYVHSDTICTTDYITDREILDRINALASVETLDNKNNEPFVSWNNDEISFNERLDVWIYDITGKLITSDTNTEKIGLDRISKGLYIVVYRKESKIYKTKIIKK